MKKIMGCGGLKIGVYQTSVALILAWLQLSHSNQVAKPATGWHLIQSCGLSVKFLWGPAANVKRHMLISTLLSHFGVLFTNLIFFFRLVLLFLLLYTLFHRCLFPQGELLQQLLPRKFSQEIHLSFFSFWQCTPGLLPKQWATIATATDDVQAAFI